MNATVFQAAFMEQRKCAEPVVAAAVVLSLLSYAMCAAAFYMEAAHLEDAGLGGTTSLDQFLRFSVITLLISALFGIIFLLVVRPWSRGVACAIYFEVLLHHVVTIFVFGLKKERIVNSFQHFFVPGAESGPVFQQMHNCCGWDDLQSVAGQCASAVPCKAIVESLIPGNPAVLYSLLSLCICIDVVLVSISIYLVRTSYAPLPRFEITNISGRRGKSPYGYW